jgi:hypothetical protein
MRVNRTVVSIVVCLAFASGGYLFAAAQDAASEPRTVRLVSRKKTPEKDNYVHATFSFEYGVNGEEARKITRNDWDLIFGNSPTPDSFDVTTVTDDCSRILDLGEFTWNSKIDVPRLAAHAQPTREPSVKAIVGHGYLVHTKDRDTDLYAIFRVEELEPGESVTISWKIIPSPELRRADKNE